MRSRPLAMVSLLATVSLLVTLALAACGGDGDSDTQQDNGGGNGSEGVTFGAAIRSARAVDAGDFPQPAGHTLQQIAGTLPAVNMGLATSVFEPGPNRLAFGVIDEDQTFVYGKTVVYLARRPDGKAIGPFEAPADPLLVEPPFRSRQAAEVESEIAAIYEAQVDLPRPGPWYVLAMSKAQGKVFGAASRIDVSRSSPIPAKGEPAPPVKTDTLASAGGDIDAIETRVPPDEMHEKSFDDVVGKRPVALLFATPQLCQTRVCGPVTDIAAQMQREYGDRMEFIHQEVFVDNELDKGYRRPLRRFGLETEPWLFTVDGRGRVAARLEGSFGNDAFRDAIEAAL
ncbi:MAG: hypothetical protein ACR2GL_06330 [Thermoleophilaceae bacterium]